MNDSTTSTATSGLILVSFSFLFFPVNLFYGVPEIPGVNREQTFRKTHSLPC